MGHNRPKSALDGTIQGKPGLIKKIHENYGKTKESDSGNIAYDDVWRSTTPNLPIREKSKPPIKKYMDGSSKILKLIGENSIKFKEQSLEDFIYQDLS
jgi:hypothetical protein